MKKFKEASFFGTKIQSNSSIKGQKYNSCTICAIVFKFESAYLIKHFYLSLYMRKFHLTPISHVSMLLTFYWS